jgi:hypothetical protein
MDAMGWMRDGMAGKCEQDGDGRSARPVRDAMHDVLLNRRWLPICSSRPCLNSDPTLQRGISALANIES